MNTPAHLVMNLALVPRRRWAGCALAVLLGALAPDAMMFVFYGYQKLAGTPEPMIWREAYFEAGWQNLFDLFNSFPIIAALGLLGWWRRSLFIEALAASMFVHCLLDFPLHHDDAHRHFFPFSDWRFASPVSYWDPRFYGDLFVAVEFAIVGCATVAVLRSGVAPWVQVASVVVACAYVAFLIFAWVHWGGMD